VKWPKHYSTKAILVYSITLAIVNPIATKILVKEVTMVIPQMKLLWEQLI